MYLLIITRLPAAQPCRCPIGHGQSRISPIPSVGSAVCRACCTAAGSAGRRAAWRPSSCSSIGPRIRLMVTTTPPSLRPKVFFKRRPLLAKNWPPRRRQVAKATYAYVALNLFDAKLLFIQLLRRLFPLRLISRTPCRISYINDRLTD